MLELEILVRPKPEQPDWFLRPCVSDEVCMWNFTYLFSCLLSQCSLYWRLCYSTNEGKFPHGVWAKCISLLLVQRWHPTEQFKLPCRERWWTDCSCHQWNTESLWIVYMQNLWCYQAMVPASAGKQRYVQSLLQRREEKRTHTCI